ncbi:methyltransferase [Legionella spiritensis]|uniref:O-methyltransferase n=1 Tax=Legionella spiritensis TaxID=452 RepID=A0A0W0Z2P6_LEGSP|nr:methyltransferase [Legionella spiritensis]KTD63362.1 O-methyltransferase [Legionella spiritensis]SNV35338.1 O-methyltransferase [Legionella spiritensis]
MPESQTQPHVELATMSRWYVVSRAIHTVAKLGIANYMSSEPVSVKKLAEATGAKPELLDRLLRFLSAYRIFHHQADSLYSLTELSKPLRDDDPHSIRDVLCMVDECWWQAFSRLDTSLKTGDPAFHEQHGDDFFSFLSKHPEKQANFDKGMAKLSTYDDNAIAEAFDFSSFSSLIDMGAGRGGLVKSIARKYPDIDVILFDSHAVVQQLANDTFPKQVQLVGGNFLETIPRAEAYIFKGVLHDFNDTMMNEILSNCRRQMPSDATLLIAEQVMPESDFPHPNKTMDIVMMALLGGRQRTLKEWQKQIEPSGFTYLNHYKTDSIFSLMTFKPMKS